MEHIEKRRDNPNPKANIGFLCYVPFNFYLYKNIYEHLPNSEFILGDWYDVEGFGLDSNYLDNLLDFFSKKKVYWRFFDKADPKTNFEEFYQKYAVLVSNWYRGASSMSDNKDKKLVRVMYGHAKDPWNYGPWSAFFDLILSYGQYSQKFLSLYENSVIVGNPKFDDWFSDKIDQGQISALKSALDPDRKTILYLPTTGALSSLPIMITALNSLSADYNVVVKAHHNTNLYQQDMLEPFRLNSRIIIKTDRDDILPLLKMADYAISDNSGAIFDALLADKKIILIDFLNENFFKNKANILCRNAWGRHMGVITSKESIEQSIKQPGQEIGPIVKLQKTDAIFQRQIEADKIIQAMASADQDELIFAGRRKKIRNLSFSYNDGQSGLRAAQKISELLHKPKKMPSFLAESLELYYDSFITRKIGLPPQNPWKSKGGQREAARRYFEMKELPLGEKIMAVYKEFFE